MFENRQQNNSGEGFGYIEPLDKKITDIEIEKLGKPDKTGKTDKDIVLKSILYFYPNSKISEGELIDVLKSVNFQLKGITKTDFEIFKNAGLRKIMFDKDNRQIYTPEEIEFRNKFMDFFVDTEAELSETIH